MWARPSLRKESFQKGLPGKGAPRKWAARGFSGSAPPLKASPESQSRTLEIQERGLRAVGRPPAAREPTASRLPAPEPPASVPFALGPFDLGHLPSDFQRPGAASRQTSSRAFWLKCGLMGLGTIASPAGTCQSGLCRANLCQPFYAVHSPLRCWSDRAGCTGHAEKGRRRGRVGTVAGKARLLPVLYSQY